jgi:(p)ppGpp synthase/HD superfamily hydrolase
MRKKFMLFEQREDRDTFFARVHEFTLPYHRSALLIAKAYQVSKEAFRGAQRKRGERYFEHNRFVALIVMDVLGVREPETIAAALLHDIVEDCNDEWPIERVGEEFGAKVTSLVAAVTMPTGVFESREARMAAYHAQLHAGPPMTFHLKLSDRLHNLHTCGALTPEAQWRMVEETEAHYLPVAKERGILFGELKRVLAERKRVLRATGRCAKTPDNNPPPPQHSP